MSFGFPIKFHPIQKNSLHIHGHPNKLPPNGGDKTKQKRTLISHPPRGVLGFIPFPKAIKLNPLVVTLIFF